MMFEYKAFGDKSTLKIPKSNYQTFRKKHQFDLAMIAPLNVLNK